MPTERIIRGQHINPLLLEQAKKMRREMTPEEKSLWEALRGNRVGGWHFRRQQLFGGYIADFYCHATGVVIELDGKWHETQLEYDAARDQALSEYGIRILRIKNEEVRHNLPEVMARIAAACQERSQT